MILINKPEFDELPSIYADKLGLQYTKKVSIDHKKSLGQYFTPIEVAKLMSQYCVVNQETINILDPGCGVGILSCTLVEYICEKNPKIKEIQIKAFETDLDVLPYTEKSFAYLGEWLHKKGILLTQFICVNDFIMHNAPVLENISSSEELFDIVICNPPYFKIAKNSPINIAAKSIIYGQTNIYSIFLILSVKLLKEHGQLIFITPRSFSSGSYFRLFRQILFSLVEFKNIHLFDSRRDAFGRDNVLQENIIASCLKFTKTKEQLSFPFTEKKMVSISVSNGISDIDERKEKKYEISELINFSSDQQILHIPTSPKDDRAIKLFKSWTNTLKDFNIQISTGKVVAYRSLSWIRDFPEGTYVPLIWLNNVDKMKFSWPVKNFPKGKEKPQYIIAEKETGSILIKNLDYIFLRRFSSKEDQSKLIATPYFAKDLVDYKFLGVENHLNYIYSVKGKFDKYELLGLSALLNSKLFDVYFRTFNGNINVSATELREIPLPEIKIIKKIGKLIASDNFAQRLIDEIVQEIFNIDLKELQLWIN
ncbi:Eco57I restriction-modification methylase domain-containing protein [Pedobacter miscanthi]|uniref:Eco57I restriction-modification methylase domain-containing protein n=1 Tax=Pedobacter miscanthi TaxID=2259170 RepID=UPI00292D04E4|nr:N-6 DNA methylase [Pedobacter miscanthi]